MKLIVAVAVTVLFVSSAVAGGNTGKFSKEKLSRPGGYYEQVSNLTSLAACSLKTPLRGRKGNIIGYSC